MLDFGDFPEEDLSLQNGWWEKVMGGRSDTMGPFVEASGYEGGVWEEEGGAISDQSSDQDILLQINPGI